MTKIAILCLMLATVALAACATTATTVVSRQRLDKDAAGKLAYERIAVTSSVRGLAQGDLDRLGDGVRARVWQPADGGVPVTLQLAVTEYSTSGNKMIVSVRVIGATGRSYAEFDVWQTANAVMGAFDRRSPDTSAIADAVARYLMPTSAAPPATVDARDFGS